MVFLNIRITCSVHVKRILFFVRTRPELESSYYIYIPKKNSKLTKAFTKKVRFQADPDAKHRLLAKVLLATGEHRSFTSLKSSDNFQIQK